MRHAQRLSSCRPGTSHGRVERSEDQGRGFPPGRVDQGIALGVGIAGMRERAQELGGRLEVESKSGRTTVRAVLPAIEDVR